VRTSGVVVQKHQPRAVAAEHRVADGVVGWAKRGARVVPEVDVKQSAASLGAVHEAEAVRHMPPADTDHTEVIRTPDGLPR